jgi:hypothetical protein
MFGAAPHSAEPASKSATLKMYSHLELYWDDRLNSGYDSYVQGVEKDGKENSDDSEVPFPASDVSG